MAEPYVFPVAAAQAALQNCYCEDNTLPAHCQQRMLYPGIIPDFVVVVVVLTGYKPKFDS